MLLRQISPSHLTLEALEALERLVTSAAGDLNTYRTAFLALLFDADLWIYAKGPVQLVRKM